MKKGAKKLELGKIKITKLEMNKVKGGIKKTHCCPTAGPLNTCPPPGQECF